MKLGNLKSGGAAFLLCDMQERFRPAISNFESVLKNSQKLVEAAKVLSLPLIVSEQYPKGLGKTVTELDIGHATKCFEKTKFSMCNPEVVDLLKSLNVAHLVVFGIETHVCIQQTVIDLLELEFEVHVVADATSSRNEIDRTFALQRFQHSGAIVTTTEAVILQLVGDKDHPKFKEIQALIK